MYFMKSVGLGMQTAINIVQDATSVWNAELFAPGSASVRIANM